MAISAARRDATDALLDAAEALLVEVGYAAVTTRKLAERAGVNHGLVHYYFGSMEEVLVQTLERYTARLTARQREMYAASGPFIDKWRQAMAYLDDDLASGYQKIWYELQAMAWNHPEMRSRVQGVTDTWLGVLRVACADAMGLRQHEPTLEYLIDLVVDVQTVRTCITAAELDPEWSVDGYAIPNRSHIAAGTIAIQKARQRMAEILRILPGSSLVVAPSDTDLATPELAAGLEESFGGGGYTALQRSALLQLASDHVASALDGRESAFELHANGGIPAWRGRLRQYFSRYNELANGVLRALSVDMPPLDFTDLRDIAMTPRRPVTPPKA